jgi:transposase-like protein
MKHTSLGAGHGPQRDRSKEKFWRRALRQLAASRLSVREFCAAHQLSEASLYAWRRTLAERDAAMPADIGSAPATPAFVPVCLADAMTGPMEIVLGGGRCIRLQGPVDRSVLSEVVAALEALPCMLESMK